MIDLMKIKASEAERLAYVEGFVGTAELFARIDDAQTLARETEQDLQNANDLIEALQLEIDELRAEQ